MLVVVLRLPLPRGRVLGLVVLYGLLAFAIAYGCLYWALQDVPAGIGAVVMAVGPLLTLLLAVAHRMERLSGRAVAGAVIALGGSALIFFQSGSVDFGWTSFVLLVVAALAAAESVVISKRCRPAEPGGDELRRHDRGRRRAAGRVGGGGGDAGVARGRQDADRARLPRRRHGRRCS